MEKDDWQKTVDFLQQAFNNNYQYDVLKLLLTPDERNALITRVKIIYALLDGSINQRQLKDQLGIGIATVTRGSNSLKEVSPNFRAWIEKNLLEQR
ncbi:trp operon repressor [Frischella sp. Ac48]|uniref:Trp operon repressor homolog n=1 Tax=Frischella japonica TaxID=2741544 RepID=A0ABR7R0T1_9GAMM|nr:MULTISPECIES: trp operon repressor [Frischella]MBC9131955.1 trp operon repressor [Frischella japonica]MBX4132518.1 trp operon repressor [Frischella sp. Ac48]